MPTLAASAPAARPRRSARTGAVGLQLLLWVLLTGFYFAWNSRPNFHFTTPVWPLVLLYLGFAVVLFNSLVYLIIPRWLLRGRYLLALGGALLLLLAFVVWQYVGIQLITAYLPPESDLRRHLLTYFPGGLWPALTSVQGLINKVFDMLATMLFPLIISFMAYALIIDRRRLALERDQLGLERSYLKAQLNPQFLFNALGHLQSLTNTRDAHAPDVVLHLADLLRYTLYETDAERVPLAGELDFLIDYLALERLRHPQAHITHHVSGDPATTQHLAPLLMHPFYEQLFAGPAAASSPGFVLNSHLQIEAHALTWTLRRAPAPVPPYPSSAPVVAAQRRLQLQYPGRHDVRLHEDADGLHVFLRLEL